jgi:LL-diaminopimelate aminotransferase
MVKRNPHFIKLQGGYLFPEIAKRKKEFILQNPTASVISLGIGDTTQPIPSFITASLVEKAKALGTIKGYSGYGYEQGELVLREQVAHQLYPSLVQPHEVFISDGAKCDIGRLQFLFGNEVRIAVQDPSYPVYIDTSVMMGQTRKFDCFTKQYEGIVYMPCHAENQFFPNLNALEPVDLIYFF